jgi:hypothetical protein
MQLAIKHLWSPDLSPPSEGLPKDPCDFDVFLQIAIEEVGGKGHEVFSCRVCSPSALARVPTGAFVSALVLHDFDWIEIRRRLAGLLLHTASCANWAQAIAKLSPHVQHADAE